MISAQRRPLFLLATAALAACKDPAPVPPQPAPPTSTPASAAAPPPPRPIDAALPGSPPHTLDRHAECTKEGCTLPHLVPDEVRPALSDGAPAVIWEHTITERASLVFPRDEAVELCGVVLDGTLDLTPMDAPSARTVGARWTAFRAPGGGVTLGGTGGKAVRVALLVTLAEPGTGLGVHIDLRDRPGAPASWNWQVRKKRIDTLDFASAPDLPWAAGAYHARIGWEPTRYRWGDSGPTGSKTWEVDDHPAVVLSLLRFSDDAPVAEHDHPHEWEILAVLDGDGALVKRSPAGDEISQVRPGTLLVIPAGVKHAWKPSGKAPLFAIQAYAPPGPEQRFKKLAGKQP